MANSPARHGVTEVVVSCSLLRKILLSWSHFGHIHVMAPMEGSSTKERSPPQPVLPSSGAAPALVLRPNACLSSSKGAEDHESRSELVFLYECHRAISYWIMST